ncbi:MAG: peroxidase family protein [Chloroflexota bacterium]
MTRSARKPDVPVLKLFALVALGIIALRGLPSRHLGSSWLKRLFMSATEALDRSVGWDKLPLPIALGVLEGLRMRLRERNLSYPSRLKATTPGMSSLAFPQVQPSGDETGSDDRGTQHLTTRTPDGTGNDVNDPSMGSAGTRFGRNVPLEDGYPDGAILAPNPRVVSRDLLVRDTFVPATTLNLHAAAWIQFMVRDWLSHGKSPTDNPWVLPRPEGDDWPEETVRILRTPDDPSRTPADDGLPPTHINTETHWWDGSQIYGSSKQAQMKVRSGQDGTLIVGRNGLPPLDPAAVAQPGFWLGLGMMHALFTFEHNAICARLRADYPSWSDDDLFERARLINVALMAKIHTVEWTPAIIAHPTMKVAMRGNWWGLEMEHLHNLVGRLSKSEVISGIPGSHTDHFGVPYAMTEEFVAVYKLHPLIPDDFAFRSATDDALLQERTFPQLANAAALDVLAQVSMTDLVYSFGTANPGAVELHNYPRSLQRFLRPDGHYMDLASTDILRSRELGVPRYNAFLKQMHKNPVKTFEELTDNPVWREEIRRVYNNDIDRVDLMIGLFAEPKPRGFGFSDTAFRIFILMASRRLNSDRFFTDDFTPQIYTQAGLDWIKDNDMTSVLRRHFPSLAPSLHGVKNAFAPWPRMQA